MKKVRLMIAALVATAVAAGGCSRGKQATLEKVEPMDIGVHQVYMSTGGSVDVDSRDYTDPVIQLLGREMPLADTARVNAAIRAVGFPVKVKTYWAVNGETATPYLYNAVPLMSERLKPVDFYAADRSTLNQVLFQFSDAAGWERITAANIGRPLALSVNGKVLCMPFVNSAITGGRTSIWGDDAMLRELFPGVDSESILN